MNIKFGRKLGFSIWLGFDSGVDTANFIRVFGILNNGESNER